MKEEKLWAKPDKNKETLSAMNMSMCFSVSLHNSQTEGIYILFPVQLLLLEQNCFYLACLPTCLILLDHNNLFSCNPANCETMATHKWKKLPKTLKHQII